MNDTKIELVEEMEKDYTKNKFLFLAIKRFSDIVISFLCLLILLPIYLIIAILIKIDSEGPVFYRHKRIGKNGKTFYLYKFRSMYKDADEKLEELLEKTAIRKEWEENFKLDKDPRITRVGKVLRVTSLDELPQLLNILKGDMSIIGPRPVVEEEIKKYEKNKAKFLSVTPGLTGYWACKGRSCRSYKDRMALELYYVDNMSIWLDIKIFFLTIIAVIKGHGAK